MIAQAVGHGVSQECIAAVRGIDGRTVKTKIRLLTGICSDAAALLADRFPYRNLRDTEVHEACHATRATGARAGFARRRRGGSTRTD
ncbi:hypothetical protein PSAB6_60032 [Paraburkholderia sabiae]|nr:hypothetical protein PSAB6_60032 [Paraburkholderia sabiae]